MKITLRSGIARLCKLLADYPETRVSVPSESYYLLLPGKTQWKQKSSEGINYRVSSSQPIKNQNKEILDSVKSMGVLPLTLQKARFSAWQIFSTAQFQLCVDSPTCYLPQPEDNFQAPGQSWASAAWHLRKLWDAESNCTVLPWASNQLPFRSAKAKFSNIFLLHLIENRHYQI